MRRSLVLLTIAVSLSVGVFLGAADDLVVSRFSDYIDALRTQAGIPGLAATLIRPGETNWEHGYGRQDIERNLWTQPDTPFQLDGTTQLISTGIILRCVEEGRLSLDDRIGQFAGDGAPSPNAGATIRQVLSHTSIGADGLVFSYRPERLDSLAGPIAACTGRSLRDAVIDLLDRFAMVDSVPGADILDVAAALAAAQPPITTGIPPATLARYSGVLERLAKPYAVDSKGRSTLSQYAATTLTPASGLISTVRDLARYDAALKKGALLRPETLAVAWTPPLDSNEQRLPHGLGWFVQTYNGERVVWQFGVSDGASSSMVISVPGRGVTLILLANSQGLARPFSLATGNVIVSPFARVFLSFFVR
jgi:CubicO group peptidase (beta-lactamase class C family)